jgi:hypothetical protein
MFYAWLDRRVKLIRVHVTHYEDHLKIDHLRQGHFGCKNGVFSSGSNRVLNVGHVIYRDRPSPQLRQRFRFFEADPSLRSCLPSSVNSYPSLSSKALRVDETRRCTGC